MNERERLRRKFLEAALKFTSPDYPHWYNDPDYYAADRIKQKRRESISLASRALRGSQRDSEPPPTNGESK